MFQVKLPLGDIARQHGSNAGNEIRAGCSESEVLSIRQHGSLLSRKLFRDFQLPQLEVQVQEESLLPSRQLLS
jgi:CobQ-like glutamine amidotransferase family enzyme